MDTVPVPLVPKVTLALLDRHGVPRESVFIFVANAEERTSYSTQLGRAWPNIVVGVPTLWRQRNFIMRFFPPGTHVLSMDDDVEDIYRVKAGRNPAVMEDQTLELLHLSFTEVSDAGCATLATALSCGALPALEELHLEDIPASAAAKEAVRAAQGSS